MIEYPQNQRQTQRLHLYLYSEYGTYKFVLWGGEEKEVDKIKEEIKDQRWKD